MTIARSSVTLAVLALLTTPAFADGSQDPGDAVEQVDAPKPKIISSGQDAASGVHAFLAVTPKGPMVFWGPKDDLAELDVLSMSRVTGGFMLDTLEEGELFFETGRTRRVIKRGITGFNSSQPTIVMGDAVDPGLNDEVRNRLGGAEPKSSVAVEVPNQVAAVRFPAARHIPGGRLRGPVAHKDNTVRASHQRRLRTRARGRVR